MSLWRAASVLARPFARAWWTSTKVDRNQIPQPLDEPHASIEGPDPHQITFIGNGPVIGFGVASHSLALPGHLVRLIARGTGRGTRLHTIADSALVAHNIESRFAASAPASALVIVMLGGSDAVRLTSVRAWRKALHGLFQRINQTMPHGVGILIVNIPPVSTMPVIRGLIKIFGSQHVRTLNAATAQVASSYPNVTQLAFMPPIEPDPRRHRSAETYRRWADLIAPSAIDILREHRARPLIEVVLEQAFADPERIILPVAQLYDEAGIPPPWERVWDGERDLTAEPPETWPWPWNPHGRMVG
jgi:lysophospholipase L1-like esterase